MLYGHAGSAPMSKRMRVIIRIVPSTIIASALAAPRPNKRSAKEFHFRLVVSHDERERARYGSPAMEGCSMEAYRT